MNSFEVSFELPVVFADQGFTLVQFEIEGSIEPKDLPGILSTASGLHVNPKMGVVLSGRGPIWLLAALAHEYHPTAWVATFDPRQGIVVIQSHHPTVRVGDVFPMPERIQP